MLTLPRLLFRRISRRIACLLLLLIATAPCAWAERLHKYVVRVDEALEAMQVHACFAEAVPSKLVAASLDAALAMETAHWVGSNKRLQPNGPELPLGTPTQARCLEYEVKLIGSAGAHQHGGNPTRHVGSDLITDVGLWFWRPETLSEDENIEVSFVLPAGLAVSAPWQPMDAAGSPAYRVPHTPYEWPGTVAIGHFTERTITVPGARLHVAVLDGRPKPDEQQILNWLSGAAAAVTQLYGRFPVASLQIVVVPGARAPTPVPSAYVLRGGGPSAHFFINQRRPIEEFRADWSAVHELSHLLLPYVASEDSWLSEGLASYYQYILLARAQAIPAASAWQSMHVSFMRGRRDEQGMTLAQATEHMYSNGNYMRVYWEGAALMLLADQRLRERGAGAVSLDVVLDRLQRCCLTPANGWRAAELLQRMDELAGSTVFSELYAGEARAQDFPDLSEAYRRLGLELDQDGKLSLSADAPSAAHRDAIMAPFAREAAGAGPNLK